MNSASEITLNNLIGLKFHLSEVDEVENDFKTLYYKFYSENITLLKPHFPIQLVVLKTGFLDLAFERTEATEDKYLRIFMTTNDAGPAFFTKNRGLDSYRFIINWNVSFDSLKKPLEFTIKDACHTNTDLIWDDKYFYG